MIMLKNVEPKPKTMKAARLHQYEKPLVIEDVERPQITSPQDVIVRIAGAGVCHTDLHLVEGVWRGILNVKLPYTLGHENVGYIEDVGDAGKAIGLKKGDPVIMHPVITDGTCPACRIGEDMHCENLVFPGLTTDGGFAEYMKTSYRSVIKLPGGIDPVDLAPLADAGVTAYRAAKKAARTLSAGSYVVVIGVGGLGHIGIQSLKALTPATIIAVDIDERKLKLAKDLGAEYTVDARRDPVSEVMKITNNKGAQVVIDFVGNDTTLKYGPRLMSRAGRYIVVGYGGTLSVPAINMIFYEISFEGSLVGTYNELRELVTLAIQNKVKVVTSRYKLERVNEVLEMLKRGEILGRAVLTP